MRIIFAVCLLVGLSIGCATGSRREGTMAVARFFLETSGGGGRVTLPRSEVSIEIGSKPVLTEFDLAQVEIAEVELGRCVLFRFTPDASRDLYRLTGSNQGRRLVLVIDGQAVGARRIERPLEEGVVLIFVERADSELPALVDALRGAIMELRKARK